jgi:hypothetical protein
MPLFAIALDEIMSESTIRFESSSPSGEVSQIETASQADAIQHPEAVGKVDQ